MHHLLIFGLGYSGAACARVAAAQGAKVSATIRTAPEAPPPDVTLLPFADAAESIHTATHILSTIPPGEQGDPVLARYAAAIAAAPALRWIGYLSTTGVYGDRNGATVDETTAPAPGSDRARRRLHAEQQWRDAAGSRPLDIIRLAGIYGPGRSALDDLRAGRARRIVSPGHAFGRIHVEDIAHGVAACMAHPPQSVRILNFSDDSPAEPADVTAEAARLLGLTPPDPVRLEDAWPRMSDMARSFWAENRRVDSTRTQAQIAYRWRYPSYREGLRAILAQEGLASAAMEKRGHGPA